MQSVMAAWQVMVVGAVTAWHLVRGILSAGGDDSLVGDGGGGHWWCQPGRLELLWWIGIYPALCG